MDLSECGARITIAELNYATHDSRMVGSEQGALRVTSVRLSEEDVSRVTSLALGDETFSQTVRRVIREAAQRAVAPARATRANLTRRLRQR